MVPSNSVFPSAGHGSGRSEEEQRNPSTQPGAEGGRGWVGGSWLWVVLPGSGAGLKVKIKAYFMVNNWLRKEAKLHLGGERGGTFAPPDRFFPLTECKKGPLTKKMILKCKLLNQHLTNPPFFNWFIYYYL